MRNPGYVIGFMVAYGALALVTAAFLVILVVRAIGRIGRRGACLLVFLFSLVRTTEYVLRVDGWYGKHAPRRNPESAIRHLLFILPMALLFSAYTTLLAFWARLTSVLHQHFYLTAGVQSELAFLRFYKALLLLNFISYGCSILLFALVFVIPGERSTIVGATNIMVATLCLVITIMFAIVRRPLATLDSAAITRGERDLLSHRGLQIAAPLTVVSAVCLIIYAVLLLYDCVFLFTRDEFSTGSDEFTDPMGLLVVFRLCEIVPCLSLLYVVALTPSTSHSSTTTPSHGLQNIRWPLLKYGRREEEGEVLDVSNMKA